MNQKPKKYICALRNPVKQKRIYNMSIIGLLPSYMGSPKPSLLLDKLGSVALVQSARVQESAIRGLIEVNLEVLLIDESDSRVAVIRSIGKLGVGRLGTGAVNTLDVTRTTSNNIHWGLGIIHSVGIGSAVVHGREALRVVHVSEHTKIDAVLVEDVLKCRLARGAAVVSTSAVPRSVAGNNKPGCHRSVDRGKICLEEVDLLVGRAEWSAVQLRRAIGSIGRVREVSFGVDHDNVGHAVLEGVPEGRIGKAAGLSGEGLGRGVG